MRIEDKGQPTGGESGKTGGPKRKPSENDVKTGKVAGKPLRDENPARSNKPLPKISISNADDPTAGPVELSADNALKRKRPPLKRQASIRENLGASAQALVPKSEKEREGFIVAYTKVYSDLKTHYKRLQRDLNVDSPEITNAFEKSDQCLEKLQAGMRRGEYQTAVELKAAHQQVENALSAVHVGLTRAGNAQGKAVPTEISDLLHDLNAVLLRQHGRGGLDVF